MLGEISFEFSGPDWCTLSLVRYNSIVAYEILRLGSTYITRALNDCIGGLVHLGALHDQIQLTYFEITAMMRPNAFVLDLLMAPPSHTHSDLYLREVLPVFRKVNEVSSISHDN